MLNLKKIKNQITPHKLLYLSKSGSTLYGTDSENSDVDYKGILLPDRDFVLTGKSINTYTYSSGKNDSKNSKDDIDVQIYSLPYFLKLLAQGETGAVDLLFSINSPKNHIAKDSAVDSLYKNRSRLFNPKRTKAFVGYAIGQAKRYSLKGKRLDTIKNVYGYLQNNSLENSEERLKNILEKINNKFYDKTYCFLTKSNNILSLSLCGTIHQETITIKEFYSRVKKHYDQYGDRSRKAMEEKGIDRKAISHGIRCCLEIQEILETGDLVFPLREANFIKNIKYGKHDLEYLNDLIQKHVDLVDNALDSCSLDWQADQNFIDDFILDYYREGPAMGMGIYF